VSAPEGGSVRLAVTETLERLEDEGRRLGAVTTVLAERALAEAGEADRRRRAGVSLGPLDGVPVAVKDVIDLEGQATAMGTAGLGRLPAERDAACVRRLRSKGAVIVAKTTTHELALGMTTPGCHNPARWLATAGGSSGGSAAVVAAGIVPLALGTDTGGSVRNPAALTGVVGLRLGVGAAPVEGVAPLAPSLDSLGVLGRSVEVVAEAAGVIAGQTPARSSELPPRLGWLEVGWARRVEAEVGRRLGEAVGRLEQAGATVERVELSDADLAPAAAFVAILAESAAIWWPKARACPDALSERARRRLEVGTGIRAIDYYRALSVGRALRDALRATLGALDGLLLPACPVQAVPAGVDYVRVSGRFEAVDAVHARPLALASVTGLAACSVPVEVAPGELPVGLQIVGLDWARLVGVAGWVEAALSSGKPR